MKREGAQKEKGKWMVIRNAGRSLVQEAGQSLVEFALVTLFVILPVTFGIIDGSILLYKWVALTNGAREGARAGAIYQDSRVSNGSEGMMLEIDAARGNVITQTVEATIGPLVSLTCNNPPCWWVDYPDEPCVSWTGHTCDVYDVYRGGDRVTVVVTHTHTSMVGLVIGLGEVDLSATATMRIEPGGPAPTPTPTPP